MLQTLVKLVNQYYTYNACLPESIEVSTLVNELIQQDLKRLHYEPTPTGHIFQVMGVDVIVIESRELTIKLLQGEKF